MWEIECRKIDTGKCYHREYMPNCNSREAVLASPDYAELAEWVKPHPNCCIVVRCFSQRASDMSYNTMSGMGYND